jgi:predicted acyltransferase
MVLYIVTGTAFVQASIASTLHHSGHYLLSPFSKLPPSPGFLIFYGGIGLLILAGFLWIEHSGIGGWYVRNLEIIGRNSLFVFVLQYFVYFTLLHEFHPGYTVLWPLIFLLSLLIIWVGAMVWDKRGWNRYLRLPIFSRG